MEDDTKDGYGFELKRHTDDTKFRLDLWGGNKTKKKIKNLRLKN